jgi:hypothetical protein
VFLAWVMVSTLLSPWVPSGSMVVRSCSPLSRNNKSFLAVPEGQGCLMVSLNPSLLPFPVHLHLPRWLSCYCGTHQAHAQLGVLPLAGTFRSPTSPGTHKADFLAFFRKQIYYILCVYDDMSLSSKAHSLH